MAGYEEYEEYDDSEYDHHDHFSNAMIDHTDEEAQARAAYQAWSIPPAEFESAEAQVPSAYDTGVTTEDTTHAITYNMSHIQGP